MAGYAEVGGNGSVEWTIDVDTAVWNTSKAKTNGGGHRQAGVDNSDSAKPGRRFKVSVKLPKKSQQFLNDVRTGLHSANTKGRLEFTVPIEQQNRDQIRITWGASSEATRARPRGGTRRPRAARRKVK